MKVACKIIFALACLSLVCCGFKDIGHFDFKPNEPVTIKNPLLWKVSASCHLHTTDDSDMMKGDMKKGTGSLNGKDVGKGMELEVKNGDTLKITASALASVEIINEGVNTVSADCGLSYETISEIEYIQALLLEEKEEVFQFLS